MNTTTRQPVKLRRHHDDQQSGARRQPRPAPRRQLTRSAQIRAALREA